MSNDASKGYKFNIQNGSVTAVYEVRNGATRFEHMDNDEVWSVNGSQVIKTEYDDGRLEITTYADVNGDGVFAKVSKSYAPSANTSTANAWSYGQQDSYGDDDNHTSNFETGSFEGSHDGDNASTVTGQSYSTIPGAFSSTLLSTPTQFNIAEDNFADDGLNANASLSSFENSGREKYVFTVESGQVTRVQELEHGFMQEKFLRSNEQYSVDANGDVLKLEAKSYGQEITRYTDVDRDGLYAKVSEEFVSNSTISVPATQTISSFLFYGSAGDDAIGLTADGSAIGGFGADQFIFRELGHVGIDDFNHNEGDRIVIDTGLGFKSVEHLAQYITGVNYDGNDTVIEFGESVSITLVGTDPSAVSASDFFVLS
ncbi:MAG: hypothetical protein ACD_10C00657G0001 [uncultured bacterium]|nr:MAG: hypothetical protein ACD_10C00657G0001 [uncultured bacterium]